MTGTTRYAEVLAKIGAERSKLLNEAKLKTLTETKTLFEFASQLHDTAYQEKIVRISPPLSSRKLERAFKESLVETYLKIIKYSPKRAASYLRILLLRIEVENIKTLVKAVNAGLTLEEKESRVYLQAENFLKRTGVFEEAARAMDLKQLANAFKKTEYAPHLSLGMKRYEETGSTMFGDILLDKAFYEKLVEAFSKLPRREKKHAIFYARNEFEGFVLTTLLRGKTLNYDPQWLRVALPQGSFDLHSDQLDALLEAPNYESALSILLKGPYHSYFTNVATPEETIADAQKAFRKALLNHAVKARLTETFNIEAPLAFMIQKETEIANLTAISVGVEASAKPETIQQALLLRS